MTKKLINTALPLFGQQIRTFLHSANTNQCAHNLKKPSELHNSHNMTKPSNYNNTDRTNKLKKPMQKECSHNHNDKLTKHKRWLSNKGKVTFNTKLGTPQYFMT